MIDSEADWLRCYRENRDEVWVRVSMTAYRREMTKGPKIVIVSQVRYFCYSDYDEWKDIVENCRGKMVVEIQLRFRSNTFTIDTSSWAGVYLIRSVMGTMGGDSRHHLVVGQWAGNVMHKQMILIPELTIVTTYDDPIDQCFKEATHLNG